MEKNYVFIIIIVIVLVLLYFNMYNEYYTNGSSYDITPSITTNMDWKGSSLSKLPYYPNNLVNASPCISNKIKELQTYQPESDGPTDTTYVSNNYEGFSMMNPYVKHHN